MKDHPLWLYSILILILIIAITLWLGIFSNVSGGQKTPRIEMLVELSKVLAQLVFVTLIGATVTFIYSQHAKAKENDRLRLEEDNKLRRDLLNSLIDVRAEVEKTRREFRLLPPGKQPEGYGQAIQNLLQARLNLSHVWHGTETWNKLYLDDSPKIQEGLKGMKIYLDNIIDEYESALGHEQVKEESTTWFSRRPRQPESIVNSTRFVTFVTGEGGDSYTKEFLEKNYRNAARTIRQHLLPPEP